MLNKKNIVSRPQIFAIQRMPRKGCRGDRVCVLMVNSPNIHMYAHHAAMVNYMYATHHGYDFVVVRCPRREDMMYDWMWDDLNEYVLVWSKAPLVRRYLPLYDYLLFIDSDAVVIDMEKSVHAFMAEHGVPESASLVVSQDCINSKQSDCHTKQHPNTGVMLFRNNDTTLQLLDEWMAAPLDGTCAEFTHVHTREQACLEVLRKRDPRWTQAIHVLPVSAMNGTDGNFVRHYMGTSPEERHLLLGQAMCNSFIVRDACSAGSARRTTTEHFSTGRRQSCIIVAMCISFMLLVLGWKTFGRCGWV